MKRIFFALLVLALASPCAFADDHQMSPDATLVPEGPHANWFKPDPKYTEPYNAAEELKVFSGKYMNKTAFPPVDLGTQLYERGQYTPRPTWLGETNPIMSAFMMYGDVRVAAANYDNGSVGANGKTDKSEIAARLNLDMDLPLTATERIHAFARPLDRNGTFTSYQINAAQKDQFVHPINFNLKTLFFEGDIGSMTAGLRGYPSRFDMPIALGRIPIATQNGIWIEDAFDGGAIGAVTAKNIPSWDVSNFDITLFTGLRKVLTGATPGDDRSKIFGVAGFADARRGYIEWGYGYTNAENSDFSYHNVTAAFTKRYKGLISNSVRVIGNFGQKAQVKTADGYLLLLENSLITSKPSTLIPYANFFAGFREPQSLARAGDSGGVLRNTGINFESDGLTGYPTLDATARNSYGGALGVEYLFNLDRQIIVEGARLQRRNNSVLTGLDEHEYALGARYQHPLNNAWILRLDAMRARREGLKDIYGTRIEIRRKF